MYGDLDRPPLATAALTRALAPDGYRLEVLASAASTNAVVAERARGGEAHGLVVVAEEQTAGRGRLDRSWVSPPRAGLTFSVLLRPALPPEQLGWVPLWAGVAVAQALRDQAEVDAELKWPNDVLVGGKKVAGLLAEAVGGAVVVGIGLNVSTHADELPHDQATSLLLVGGTADRDTLLKAILRGLTGVLGDRDKAAYRAMCGTLGREVRIDLPGRDPVQGVAQAIDDDGRIVIDGVAYAAGDVLHLR